MSGDRTRRSWARRSAGSLALPVVMVVVLTGACVMNGTWAAVAPAVVPVQEQPTGFRDVSCVSEQWCMAVGRSGLYPMVQVWDGTGWSVVQAPPIQRPGAVGAGMSRVACGTPTSCVARIDRQLPDPGPDEYVVVWDGGSWHEVPPVEPVDGFADDDAPFSCAPDGGCVLVISEASVTIEWDGSQLTTTPFATSRPGFGDVQGIECLAADECLALTTTELQRWDGVAWSTVVGSDLAPLSVLPLTDVACGSSASCVAYASDLVTGASIGLHWDGAAWASAPLPEPTQLWGGDLSCAGPVECVGFTHDGASRAAVAWNGAGWSLAPEPPTGVQRLSCRALHCLAVGSTGSPSTPVAAAYTWTNP